MVAHSSVWVPSNNFPPLYGECDGLLLSLAMSAYYLGAYFEEGGCSGLQKHGSSTTLVQRLCVVLQPSPIHINGAELQYQATHGRM